MYAIIADSGKQFKVEEGLELEVDLRDANEGEEITFDRVLAVSTGESFQLGQPTVEGASVSATVLGTTKGDKITFKSSDAEKTLVVGRAIGSNTQRL